MRRSIAGTCDELLDHSRRLMRRPAVWLNARQRVVAGRAFIAKLLERQVEVLAFALGACHYRLLARFEEREARRLVGLAKKNASHALTDLGLPGVVWAKRCRLGPIHDRAHEVNTFRYIRQHGLHGAWVWTFRDGVP